MLRYKYRLPVSGAAFAVLIAFIYSLSSTLIMPVFPLFLKSLVNKSAYVGYFMSFIYFLVLIYILISTYFLKNNKITILKFSVFGFGITIFLLTIINSVTQLIILEIFRTLFIAVNFVVMGLLIRDASTKKTISKKQWLTIFWVALFGGALGTTFMTKALFLTGFKTLFCFAVPSCRSKYSKCFCERCRHFCCGSH